MQYGCTATIQECSLVQKAGYDYVEISGKAIAAMPEEEFNNFTKSLTIPVLRMNAFAPADVIITGPGYDRTRTITYARHLVQRANRLGVTMIGVGSPLSRTVPADFDPCTANKQIGEFLTDVSAIFSPYGIKVCLEPLATCYCNTVNTLAEALNIVRDINDINIRIVLDFYNMEHMGEADICLKDAVPYIIHGHISDDDGNPRSRSYLKPEKKLLHQRRVKGLVDLGYKGNFTLETDVPFDQERAIASLTILKDAASIL